MFGNQPKFKIWLLGLDITILLFIFFLAGKGWMGWGNHFSAIIYIFPVTLFLFFINNLYKRNIIYTHYRQFVLICKSLLIACLVSMALMVLLQYHLFIESGLIFLLRYLVFSFLFAFFRALLVEHILRLFSKNEFLSTNILIAGAGKTGAYVAETLNNDDVFNINIAGFVDNNKRKGEKIKNRFENLGTLEDIDAIVKEKQINEILIVMTGVSYHHLIEAVEQCLQTGLVVRIYSDFLEIITEKINVEYYAGIPVVMLRQESSDAISWKIKRVVDVVGTAAGIILLSPLFLIVAAGIKLSSKGPVIFKQTRIGKNGKPFDFYKFRSMHMETSSENHREYVQDFIKGGSERESGDINVFKIKDDPRIFPFGKFIRKTSIDEFPQLFNVLKGDMSLVGPRPCLPYEWDYYNEWHKNRLNILPGCTGLWQILGRSSVTFEEMVVLDLYYISNVDFLMLLDIRIVLQTFPVIFLGKGGF